MATRVSSGDEVARAILQAMGVDLGQAKIIESQLTMRKDAIATLDIRVPLDREAIGALAQACRDAGLVVHIHVPIAADRQPEVSAFWPRRNL